MRFAAIAFVAALAAPSAAHAQMVVGQDQPSPRFEIEKVFVGPGAGRGEFVNSLKGAKRPFTVRFRGTRTGSGLDLAEDVAYADGEKERHVWRFTRTAPDRYEGRRDDVVGVATGKVDGNTLRLSYDVKLNTGGSTAQVHFDDVLVLHAPGVVLNKAKVSALFIPVGTVDLAIRMSGKGGGRRR